MVCNTHTKVYDMVTVVIYPKGIQFSRTETDFRHILHHTFQNLIRLSFCDGYYYSFASIYAWFVYLTLTLISFFLCNTPPPPPPLPHFLLLSSVPRCLDCTIMNAFVACIYEWLCVCVVEIIRHRT